MKKSADFVGGFQHYKVESPKFKWISTNIYSVDFVPR